LHATHQQPNVITTEDQTTIMIPLLPADHARPPDFLSMRLVAQLLLVLFLVSTASAMTPARQLQLREEAREMFRHGWQSYWEHGFPEDEVRDSLFPLYAQSPTPVLTLRG
jgi:hypothetical protein